MCKSFTLAVVIWIRNCLYMNRGAWGWEPCVIKIDVTDSPELSKLYGDMKSITCKESGV